MTIKGKDIKAGQEAKPKEEYKAELPNRLMWDERYMKAYDQGQREMLLVLEGMVKIEFNNPKCLRLLEKMKYIFRHLND